MLLAACAVAAAWIALSPIHDLHQEDSLIPTLVSLVQWTPYYWGQDRFGMLIPLLLTPVRHPFANLLLEVGLAVFGGLAAVVLLARYVAPGRGWPLAAGLGAAAVVALAGPWIRFAYLVELPFGVALALCLGGLLVVRSARPSERAPGRLALGVLLVGLGHWVNAGAGLPLLAFEIVGGWRASSGPGPGAPLHGLGSARRHLIRRLVAIARTRSVLVLLVGFITGDALRLVMHPFHRTSRGLIDPWDWPHAWMSVAREVWRALAPSWWPFVLTGIALGGVLLAAAPAGRRALRASWPGVLAALVSAIVYTALVAPMRWVAHNGFGYRYFLPAILLLQAALLVCVAAPVAALLPARMRGRLGLVGAVLVVASAAWTSGVPSLHRARAAVDERLGERTADVLALGATHIAGDSWCVWPAVFHANLTLYERGEARWIWGITNWPERTWDRAPQASGEAVRIATAPGDVLPALLARYGLTSLVVVERRPTAWLLRPPAVGVSGEPLRERYEVPPPSCPRTELPPG